MKKRIFILISCFFAIGQISFAQKDSIVAKSVVVPVKNHTLQDINKAFKPIPKRALLYSAIVPGLGQIYNRSYWKVPFVYAGYAALVYAISWNGKYYTKYKSAYVSYVDDDATTNQYLDYIPVGYDESTIDSDWFSEVLNQKQLSYRNNRDLSIISIVGFYGLTLLDAYVDAELFDFDISPDLSLRLEPFMNNSLNYNSTTLGLRCQLTF